MYTDCNSSGMFTPSSLTASQTTWLTQKHTGHTMHASFYPTVLACVRQCAVQTVPEVHSDIHIGLQ